MGYNYGEKNVPKFAGSRDILGHLAAHGRPPGGVNPWEIGPDQAV
jgi:hypothetical protein